MPGPLFILSREKERAAIDRVTYDPAKRALLYQMVEAVWTVRENGKATKKELSPIRAGFLSAEEGIWSRAGGWLAKLVVFDPELMSVVEELATHNNEAIRCRLCGSLIDPHFSDALVWPRLKRFLADPSHEVRDMAVRVCIKRKSVKLVPALETALAEAPDVERRKRLQMAIALIKGEPYWLVDDF